MTESRELILYAIPSGPLATRCDDYFRRATREVGATTAQEYPPHVTLTGFFRRSPVRAPEVIAELTTRIAEAGAVPDGGVAVVALAVERDWVGLHIDSPWLRELMASIIDRHRLAPGEEVLRPKTRLHLSLAYAETGSAEVAPAHLALAREIIDPDAPAAWEVAVWERTRAGSGAVLWRRHGEGESARL